MGEGYAEPGRQVKILSEEVFYNKEYKSHRVLIVDSPFEGGTRVAVTSSTPPSDDLIPVEERNAGVLSEWLQGLAGEVLHNIDASIRKFNRTYEIIEGFETEAARRLEDQCFNAKSWVFGTEAAQEFASRSGAHAELVEEAVEGYVMHGVHSKVWTSLEGIYGEEDSRLSGICHRIGGITLKELGLREELCIERGVPEAEAHLIEMPRHLVPRDKLRCVQRATTSLTSTLEAHLASLGLNDSKYALTTDDVLPLLIYAIIRANIACQVTCSRYLSYFNSSSISTSELGFHLANYQAAVEYLGEDKLVSAEIGKPQGGPAAGMIRGPRGGRSPFGTSLSASPEEDPLHQADSDLSASPNEGDTLTPEGKGEGCVPVPQLLIDLLPELAAKPVVGTPLQPNRVPKASIEFTPMQQTAVMSPTAVAAAAGAAGQGGRSRQASTTGKEDDLGDFLESLRDEGSTSLSSHQFRGS